jgi:nickel/cobalt transporter (NicO) family protein
MLTIRRTLALTVLAALVIAGAAHAQSPLGVGSAEPAFSVGGPFGPFLAWINTHQQAFYRALTGALRAMREDPWALSGLIGLSFAYGVFHAAGPGHGKAVISSYMIANEIALKRGIVISFVSSLLQGAVAILLVGTAFVLLRGSGISMTQATQAMEIASFALVALFGAWLLFRKIHALRMRVVSLPMAAPAASAALGGRGSTGLISGRSRYRITNIRARATIARPAASAICRTLQRWKEGTSACGKPGRRSLPSACAPVPVPSW